MSSIIAYKCSNAECSLSVSLHVNFPVWRDDTPAVLMRVPIMSHNEKYVIGSTSQSVCWGCNKIVDVKKGEDFCPNCGTAENLLGEGKPCLKCHNGIVIVDEDGLVSF